MSDVLDYDKSIIGMLQHIENVLVTYSLQNYATAGAVFVVYYTQKDVPRWVSVTAIIVLGAVFLLAIIANAYRYTVIYRMHKIIRDRWLLTEQTELRNALYADKKLEEYLATPVTFSKISLPAVFIAAMPLLAGLVQLIIYFRYG